MHLSEGQDVTIKDTANDREREAKVRKIDEKWYYVFVPRFNAEMMFSVKDYKTPHGRFVIIR